MSPHPWPSGDTHLSRYQRWLHDSRGLAFGSYDELWQWSVDELEAFWASVWNFCEMQSPTPYVRVLSGPAMPGAKWFEGAQVNYTRQVLRHGARAHAAGCPALVWADEAMVERGEVAQLSWPELQRQAGALALALRGMGVQAGDRVGAVLPNTPHTVVAFLACASLGAIWSLCSPDMGPVAILDRFSQIEPKVLIACDGYRFGGVAHDRRVLLGQVLAGLPTVEQFVRWSRPEAGAGVIADERHRPTHELSDLLAADGGAQDQAAMAFEPPWLPFDHPLWVVYSSGTTGLPKPIVHGHGGVMIEALKAAGLNNDTGASADTGDRVCWNSSTTWIVWNGHIANLLAGVTVCLYEGNASGRMTDAQGKKLTPDWNTLWRFVALSGANNFGAGAAFYAACQKAGALPMQGNDLSRLRTILSTGSPLADDTFEWLWQHLPRRSDGSPVWLNVISGGTDVACAFVGGVPGLPVIAGEMQGRCLGVAVQAWGEVDAHGAGKELTNEVGELVVVKPMPSMPLYFWNDADVGTHGAEGASFTAAEGASFTAAEGASFTAADGASFTAAEGASFTAADGASPPSGGAPGLGRPGTSRGQRYHDSYFDMYAGIWRHGDWIRITPHPELGASGSIIYGRSDATINRHGIRMGTAELYRAVDALPQVMDSLVVDLEYLGQPSWMALFVVLREGLVLDAALTTTLKLAVRQALSPRHVPDEIFQVSAVPRTLSGKKMELPVKKLLMGAPAESVLKRDAMANAECVDWFVELAERRAAAA